MVPNKTCRTHKLTNTVIAITIGISISISVGISVGIGVGICITITISVGVGVGVWLCGTDGWYGQLYDVLAGEGVVQVGDECGH